MSGYNCRNKKQFNSRRKVESEFAITKSLGRLFQICGDATRKFQLPTVVSLTGGTMGRLVLVERSGRRLGKLSTRTS